jgi:16S rRNA (cytosine967-C5)-methyltransferase
MSIAPARLVAFELLLELRQKGDAHSDTLLHSRRVESLSALDKNLATTLVMGVLRWQLVLQQRIRAALTKGNPLAEPVQIALELGAVQLLLLDRIPAHAAIFESVELVRHSGNPHAAGFANAVLRKLSQTPRLSPADAVAAHPQWLIDRWTAAYGKQAVEMITQYDQQPPPVAVRPSSGRIQDPGSRLIAELAGHGANILDCCAAPGGKTAILAERNPTATITACDISPRRLKAMQAMLGDEAKSIHFRVLDATDLPYKREFDLILCDAPCSGTGTLARNPEIRYRLKPEDLGRHHKRQVKLLLSAMEALREGGRLIYSTCSLEEEENEAVVAEALKAKPAFHLQPWRERIAGEETANRLFPKGAPDNYLRLLPGSYPSDGFFAACLTVS